jgi:hypothetical protein
MGWAGGARLAGEVWAIVREKLEPSDRREVAQRIIGCFRGEDADAGWEDEEHLMSDAGDDEECDGYNEDDEDDWLYDDDFDDDDDFR